MANIIMGEHILNYLSEWSSALQSYLYKLLSKPLMHDKSISSFSQHAIPHKNNAQLCAEGSWEVADTEITFVTKCPLRNLSDLE